MSQNQGIEDYNWAVNEIHLAMKICGIHFDNDRSKWLQSLMTLRAIFLASIVINFILFPAIPAMIKVWGHLTLVIDNLIIFIPFVMSICNLFSMWCNRKEVGGLFQEIEKDWMIQRPIAERNIMIKNAKTSMNIIRFAYITATCLISTHNMQFWVLGIIPRTLTNLTDGERPLLIQTYYMYDVTTDVNFMLTAIGQTLSTMVAALCYTTAGCIFYTFVFHICGQLEILKILMENMFGDNEQESDKLDESAAQFFKVVVRRHQELIKFAEMVEDIFNMLFLQQFLGSMISISSEGFLIISMIVGDVDVPAVAVIFVIIYAIYCIVMTLVYCTGGEYLIASSEAIYTAIYNSHWYNSERLHRMELTVIINRAQRPLYITIGKFTPISLTTFTNFMKTTGSYMSVLLAVKS
uniref:Odorant receptor n=1 Tax=Meteorus pulchricornis TaxID=51522 RepID=A0A1S5VFK3_9HYME|nr:olfactory receptor 19 [Meteorus pulchricornis]